MCILSELEECFCAFYRNTVILGITDKTIKKYVDYLSQAFLIQLLTRHSFKSKERIRNQKAYIVDPGLQGNRDNALAPENMGRNVKKGNSPFSHFSKAGGLRFLGPFVIPVESQGAVRPAGSLSARGRTCIV